MIRPIEVIFNDKHLWMYREDIENCDGPLMPTQSHDMDTMGMGESYAHLFDDGKIRRYQEVIGTIDDLKIVDEIIS
ncbi:MAG: hypothetical protein V3T23_01695 [Nitrososphaerales archaeon]